MHTHTKKCCHTVLVVYANNVEGELFSFYSSAVLNILLVYCTDQIKLEPASIYIGSFRGLIQNF